MPNYCVVFGCMKTPSNIVSLHQIPKDIFLTMERLCLNKKEQIGYQLLHHPFAVQKGLI